MRLPYPERVPLVPVFFFAILLCAIQLYEKTSAPFSLGCLFFVLISAVAFNVGGGLTRPSGGYIFFYATLTVIIGIIWKAVLGEPRLQSPKPRINHQGLPMRHYHDAAGGLPQHEIEDQARPPGKNGYRC